MKSSPENLVEIKSGQGPAESRSDFPPAEVLPAKQPKAASQEIRREIGGRPGPDPTRYGDWEKDGRCIDF